MAIVKTEAYFHSSTGQQDIRTLIWREESLSPVGVFQMAHGMAASEGRSTEGTEKAEERALSSASIAAAYALRLPCYSLGSI